MIMASALPSLSRFDGAPMEVSEASFSTCSASTTASKSPVGDVSPVFDSVCCDWLSGRHEYLREVPSRNGGRVLRLSSDGEIEWEQVAWESIRCPSSDTSLRVKCDGRRLHFSGNIGRFQHSGNLEGLPVLECIEKWGQVLKVLGFDVAGFGTRHRVGTVSECGTFLTRIDLAGNFETDNYAALCTAAMSRRIGQRRPRDGRFGPMWGYDSKRGNWSKAKLYDKVAEMEGRRSPSAGPTIGRFEVQLGSEYLKQHNLDAVAHWKESRMGQVVYGKFAEQVFRGSVQASCWQEIPYRLRSWAVLWRDGEDLRNHMSRSQFFKVRRQLLDGYGIDVGLACNVHALTRSVQVVKVRPVNALRLAA